MTGPRLDSWWDTSGVKVEKRGDVSPWPHGERTGIGATDDNPALHLGCSCAIGFGSNNPQSEPMTTERLKVKADM